MMGRVRTVEKDPRGHGWIARSPFDGRELCEPGYRWNSRSSAWHAVWEERQLRNSTRADPAPAGYSSTGGGE